MTSASMTFGHPQRLSIPQPPAWFAGLSASLKSSLRRFDRWLAQPQAEDARTPLEVYAWASRIEASQPGFAADLRAAAQRAEGLPTQ